MQVGHAIAEILKREGVKFIISYPVNPIIEAAAEADIRTIVVRQERVGLHMADAVSRLSSGNDIGVCNATWTGCRKFIRGRCPGLQRIGTYSGDACGLSAAYSELLSQL